MSTKQVEYYTKVIGSCETMEQLSTATPWMCEGFKGLQAVAENLPRRWRKLLLPVLKATKGYILNVNHSKALKLLQTELEEFASREHTESEMADKIGSLFEQMAGTFPNAVFGKVVVKRVKSDEEDSAAERPADSPDPAEPGENAGVSDPEE